VSAAGTSGAPRVLVCGTTLAQPVGGVRRHNEQLLPRVDALLHRRGGALAVLASRDGLPFELPRTIPVLASNVPSGPAYARFVPESKALRAALEDARAAGTPFDLVHTDHLPAPRGLDVPFSITLHDLKSVASPDEPRLRRLVGPWVIRDAVERSAAVLCVSRTLRDEVAELSGAAAEKLHVVPNGGDHLSAAPRRPRSPPFHLFVGRLEPRKNVELLLRLLSEDPAWPELVLAGGSKGRHETELRSLARRLRVEPRVRFAGIASDAELTELYATCACVVLPSKREGFDLPLAEALRARAPVAASSLPVHAEIAAGGATLFDPEDPADARRAVERATRSEPLEWTGATWDDAARACVGAWTSAAG
jgi:glycosyltransferase involved in cell wall biosynthesis